MTNLSNILQYFLSQSGLHGFLFCVLIFILVWLVYRYFFAALGFVVKVFQEVKKPFIPLRWSSLFWAALGGALLFSFRAPVSDGLQWAEQRFWNPVYISNDTSSFAVQCFETELSKNLSGQQMQTLVSWTDKIAQSCSSNRLALYEVYNSECALNPFAFNIDPKTGDTVACGPIQFTRVGISGLEVSYRQVKDACLKKDLEFLMKLAHVYMVRAAKGNALPNACNVYTAVFMPSFVGGGMNTVLASVKSSRPDYYWQNIGLDGHYLEGNRIMTSPKARDGKITVYDLHLHLELKKSMLLQAYPKNAIHLR